MPTKYVLPAIFILFSIEVTVAQSAFIAGLDPAHRPKDAPSIVTVEKDKAWFSNALTGVDSPFPESLLFLDDQGNWYTPFTAPGMLGPYDIRGWHSQQ